MVVGFILSVTLFLRQTPFRVLAGLRRRLFDLDYFIHFECPTFSVPDTLLIGAKLYLIAFEPNFTIHVHGWQKRTLVLWELGFQDAACYQIFVISRRRSLNRIRLIHRFGHFLQLQLLLHRLCLFRVEKAWLPQSLLRPEALVLWVALHFGRSSAVSVRLILLLDLLLAYLVLGAHSCL